MADDSPQREAKTRPVFLWIGIGLLTYALSTPPLWAISRWLLFSEMYTSEIATVFEWYCWPAATLLEFYGLWTPFLQVVDVIYNLLPTPHTMQGG